LVAVRVAVLDADCKLPDTEADSDGETVALSDGDVDADAPLDNDAVRVAVRVPVRVDEKLASCVLVGVLVDVRDDDGVPEKLLTWVRDDDSVGDGDATTRAAVGVRDGDAPVDKLRVPVRVCDRLTRCVPLSDLLPVRDGVRVGVFEQLTSPPNRVPPSTRLDRKRLLGS